VSAVLRRLSSVRTPVWGIAAVLVLAGPVDLSAQAQTEQKSTLDGVFTPEQAERGRQTYARTCVQCHVLAWYTGEVVRAWEGRSLFDLFSVISTTMPENNPGSLRRRDYVDVIAYILSLNGMPAGDQDISTGSSRLRQILFRWSDGV
jgi:mono/diheme cytochrome c family protein